MTELKTLKGLVEQDWSTQEEDMGLVRAMFFEVRQELIKWIKVYRLYTKYHETGERYYLDQILELLEIKKIEMNNLPWSIEEWIKYFGNITEEDLK